MNINSPEVKEKCIGCGACELVCPKNIIRVSQNANGFFSAEIINEKACVKCGRCASSCPVCKEVAPAKMAAFYGHAADKEIKLSGSSGGIFSAVAKDYVKNGGVVFASVMDGESGKVAFRSSDEVDVSRMSKSKYVQSETGHVYKEVKAALDGGRQVLFCGTPCQVAGLYGYLGNDPDDLLTMDFVCHGVPSPKLFLDYLKLLSQQNGNQKITNYDFRSKYSGWGKMRISYSVGERKIQNYSMLDSYNYLFEKGLSIDPACFTCGFSEHHRADIILGDLWNYISLGLKQENVADGVSMCIGNSPKGIEYLQNSQVLALHAIPTEKTAYAFKKRVKDAQPAKDFYEYYTENGYYESTKKYADKLLKKMVRSKIKVILSKL